MKLEMVRGLVVQGLLVMVMALAALGCTRTTAVTLSASPNPNGVFSCTPTADSTQMTCASEQALNNADQPFDLAKEIEEKCDFGVARLWVESRKNGRITRVQFQCALAHIEAPAQPAPVARTLPPTYRHTEPAP